MREPIKGMLERLFGNREEETKALGPLTDEEKAEFALLEDLTAQIKKLSDMKLNKITLFWAKIEERFQQYNTSLRLVDGVVHKVIDDEDSSEPE